MDDERDNALAIAEMKGDLKAIRAENEAMESRIDASLNELRTGVDASLSRMREDTSKREIRLIFAMIAIVGIGLTIFGFVTAP